MEAVSPTKGRENVAIIPFDEDNPMKETQYLLSTPKNKERPLKPLKHAKDQENKS